MVTLGKVLESLQNGESLSVPLLAVKLNDSPEAVRAALEILERMGKVQRVSMGLHCGHGCAGCASPCGRNAEENYIFQIAPTIF